MAKDKMLLAVSRLVVAGGILTQPASVPGNAILRWSEHTSIPAHEQAVESRTFDPDHQASIAAERHNIRVVFKSHERCAHCPSGYRLYFEIFHEVRKFKKSLVLENRMAQVDSIQVLSPTKTAIVGRVQASVQIVTVVLNTNATVADSFLCFRPSISPSGRFGAYIKVFPIHFVEGVSAKYLLYDFERAPNENRDPHIPAANDVDVGHPLYPAGSTNLPGDNLNLPETDTHMLASEALFWSPDSKNLAFVDWAEGRASLVVADVSEGSRSARIATKPLDSREISDSEHCVEYRDRLAFSFVVTQIEFLNLAGGPLRLRFRFNDPRCKRLEFMDVPFSDLSRLPNRDRTGR